MYSGLTFEKLLLIGFIAAIVIGPERLPHYAQQLAGLTRRVREWVRGAQSRVTEEIGEDFGDVDWRRLDPRQYDPRRIIREALLDDAPVAARAPGPASAGSGTTASAAAPSSAPRAPRTAPLVPRRAAFTADDPPPFDSEAT